MPLVVGNPDARGNRDRGARAFAKGITDPAEVFRYHLGWNRGAAADYHFDVGYRDAAEQGGMSPDAINQSLRLFSLLISDADRELRDRLWDDARKTCGVLG